MENPHLQKWLLAPDGIATRLRELRGDRTGRDFAEAAGMRAAKLSKLELAQQIPTETDIRQIVTTAGVDDSVADGLVDMLQQMPSVRTDGERRLRFGQVAAQRRMNERVAGATHVRIFESMYVPRVLQDPDYAEALLSQIAPSAEEVKPAAAALTASTQYLYEPGRKIDIVLAEPVLRWQALDAEILRTQLERILKAMSLPQLTLRVLPLDTPLPIYPGASFAIYGDVTFLDSLEEGAELTGSALNRHKDLMDRLLKAALGANQTRAVIRAAIGRLAGA